MALHEMWEVSALPLESLPYEEYFPCEVELALLEKQGPPCLRPTGVDVPLVHLLQYAWKQ